nr:immunoglobulin light chain junction region [Macaca mulatta]MOX57776.1 immunoglobulin light chain junction region [Macaca mulatta]MOY00449.1 immunoglobulin light chain junction region [Macaca mulatta]MOY01430.1 immunoglobulin light chain junction region [Macaca mulatta]
CMQSVEYPFTF